MAWQFGKSWIAGRRNNPVLRLVAKWCRKYLRAYDNQFNWDIDSNGERFILDAVMQVAPGIVFDVGANVGTYSLMCAAIPSVQKVHAFEMSPSTFQELERNCEGYPKVNLNPFGLGDSEKTVEIHHAVGASARTSLYAIEHGYAYDLLKAEVRTGDGYIRAAGLEQVSFVKIDVEGAELATLRGFEQTLRDGRILAVQFEHGEPSVESRTFLRDVVRFLALFDFTCFRLYPQCLERVDEYGYEMEDFRGRNYVALSSRLARSLEGIVTPGFVPKQPPVLGSQRYPTTKTTSTKPEKLITVPR